jgi:glyoxylase I family protein
MLHSVFLGEPSAPDAGIVELVEFDGGVEDRSEPHGPARGFFLLSFFVDLDATLARLARVGLGGPPRRIDQPSRSGPVAMATVRDPDQALVELIESAPVRT